MPTRIPYAGAALLLLGLTGCAGMMAQNLAEPNREVLERAATLEQDRNSRIQANTHAIQMALEMYAVDHAGQYPGQATLFRDLVETNYLDDGHFAPNPWSDTGAWQTTVIDPAPLTRRTTAAAQGTAMGPGQLPEEKGYGVTTYGAIIYAVDSTRQVYHLYAIGREGNQAVVKMHVSNE